MNKIILLGRLVRDPEVNYTETGKVVTKITLAVDRPFVNQEGQKEADFIPVILWGKPAELVGNSVTKGQRLLIEGRLQIRSYDAKDGSKRWITEVITSSFEFVERKNDADVTNTGASIPNIPNNRPAQGSCMESFGNAVPFDEEIPF